jgi:hypothetical protein
MDVCIENVFPAVAMPFNPFQRNAPRDEDKRGNEKRRKEASSSAGVIPDAAPVIADALFASIKAETEDPELLDGYVEYLCERVSLALRESGQQARTIGLQIRYVDQLLVRQTVRLARPSNDEDALLEEARELLASAFKRHVPIQLLGLSVTNLELWSVSESLRDADAAVAAA